MRRQEPLRISCDGCSGGCDDCLVEFFMAEREARVVRLGGDEQARPDGAARRAATASRRTTPLDPDLERALATLAAGGLQPRVIAVLPNRRRGRRAS